MCVGLPHIGLHHQNLWEIHRVPTPSWSWVQEMPSTATGEMVSLETVWSPIDIRFSGEINKLPRSEIGYKHYDLEKTEWGRTDWKSSKKNKQLQSQQTCSFGMQTSHCKYVRSIDHIVQGERPGFKKPRYPETELYNQVVDHSAATEKAQWCDAVLR